MDSSFFYAKNTTYIVKQIALYKEGEIMLLLIFNLAVIILALRVMISAGENIRDWFRDNR